MTNIAAVKTKQHGGANNGKLQVKTLVCSVGANLQANSHLKKAEKLKS